MMNLARYPRVASGHFPTPLEKLENLTRELNGPEIWIKRDDCTGLSTGGNKTRKLEFLMAEALAQGADTVMTQGATQSNHARQTAAAAAKLGLGCYLLLEDRTGKTDFDYKENGNVLLARLHGATLERCPPNPDMNGEMEKVAVRLRAEGRKVYTIPGGGSNPTGALGYVNAGIELIYQANAIGLKIDSVIHATGSAGTQAGLVAGLVGINSGVPVLGIGVRAPKQKQEENVFALTEKTAEQAWDSRRRQARGHRCELRLHRRRLWFPAPSTIDAIRTLARLEGILLDPVYSGKGMAGLIDLVKKGFFKKGQNVVFLHTGGSVGLFGYPTDFQSNS